MILHPSADTTLIESATGASSNGAGPALFAGRTSGSSGSRRRALIRFDLADAVPPDAVVTRAELTLALAPSNPQPVEIELRRALAAWGEGSSAASGGGGAPAAPGDATWLHTFYDASYWSTPGGDFAAASSATLSVGDAGVQRFGSTAAAIADLQAWLDFPESNHGWLLLSDEASPSTAKRFASREAGDPASWPQLLVEYELPCASRDLAGAAQALCHSYCEALDCDGPDPSASTRACGQVLREFTRQTRSALLCEPAADDRASGRDGETWPDDASPTP